MSTKLALCIIGLALLSSGCSLANRATHLAVHKTVQYVEECRERERNEKWAEEVWNKLVEAQPPNDFSRDYAAGFKEGFADYLYRGGNGDPPPLPPKRYRKLRYQTPEGYKAIEDWFVGYRHGTTVAREGGYRRWVTGPSALRSQMVAPEVEMISVGPIPTTHPEPILPVPRIYLTPTFPEGRQGGDEPPG